MSSLYQVDKDGESEVKPVVLWSTGSPGLGVLCRTLCVPQLNIKDLQATPMGRIWITDHWKTLFLNFVPET